MELKEMKEKEAKYAAQQKEAEADGNGFDLSKAEDEEDDQGCSCSSGIQTLAKEVELLLAGFCAKETRAVRALSLRSESRPLTTGSGRASLPLEGTDPDAPPEGDLVEYGILLSGQRRQCDGL